MTFLKRKAVLLLHKKIPCENRCICGSIMDLVSGGDWVCRRQLKLKEDNKIGIKISRKRKQ